MVWGLEMLAAHASEIWSAVAGAVAGALGGSLLTLKLTRSNTVSGSGRVLDQSGSKVRGDQIGGNKTHR